MAEFPIFTPPSPAPFFNLPKQPDYSGGIATGIGGIGESFRANRAEDFAAQKLADENAYRNAQIETEKRGQDITAAHYATDAGPGGEKWFGNTVPINGPNGPKLVINSDRGNTKELPLPPGYKPTGGKIQFHDMGSWWAATDNFGNPVTDDNGVAIKWQKDLAGAASLAKQGELQGTAAANLATIEDAQKQFNRDIDAVTNNPNLGFVVGPIYSKLPTGMDLSGGRQKVSADIQSLISQSFFQAFEKLKGAGSVTEQEGAAARDAINKLNKTDVNVEDYRIYLQQAKDRMAELVELARKKAGAQPMTSTPPPATAPLFPPAAGAATAPATPGGTTPPPPPGFTIDPQ